MNMAAADSVRREIAKRSDEMWDKVKKLPATAFDNTEDMYTAIELVGLEATRIKKLREALFILEEVR